MSNFLIDEKTLSNTISVLSSLKCMLSNYSDLAMIAAGKRNSDDARIDHEASKLIQSLQMLNPAFPLPIPEYECPPDKILVDRNIWETILQDLNKEE